ncbi:MAG: hypothetical protein MUO77_17715 [Anaerolineales bacterium]|nr:hypothetical protein [Anaerolineales bacterium]
MHKVQDENKVLKLEDYARLESFAPIAQSNSMSNMGAFTHCHLYGQTRERSVFSVQGCPDMLVFWLGVLFALLFRLIFFEETGDDFGGSARCGFNRVNRSDQRLFFVSVFLSFTKSYLLFSLCWLLTSSARFFGIFGRNFVSRQLFSVLGGLGLFFKNKRGGIWKIF